MPYLFTHLLVPALVSAMVSGSFWFLIERKRVRGKARKQEALRTAQRVDLASLPGLPGPRPGY